MGISVSLYNTTDGANVLNKTLTPLGSTSCDVYDATNVLTPSLFIDHLGVTETSNVNYCYIPVFNRYYFATVVVDKQRAYINCQVDPLMSWKNDVKNINSRIIRQEHTELSLIPDNMITVLPKSESILLKCDGGFTHPSSDGVQYVVITK